MCFEVFLRSGAPVMVAMMSPRLAAGCPHKLPRLGRKYLLQSFSVYVNSDHVRIQITILSRDSTIGNFKSETVKLLNLGSLVQSH